MALQIELNGRQRQFEELGPGGPLSRVLAALELKSDRIAVERNGEIVSRNDWEGTEVNDGDRIEVVHFVGGGAGR